MSNGLDQYRLQGVSAGRADVWDTAFNARRGHVYRITGQPLDLAETAGMWGVLYPDGTRAGQRHKDDAPLQARELVAEVGINALGATTLCFRTRHDASRFALLTR